MISFPSVATHEELRNTIEGIRAAHGGEIVFRGQTDHHCGEILPSILRSGSSSYMAEEHRGWRRFVWWHTMTMVAEYQQYLTEEKGQPAEKGSDVIPDYPINAHLDAILQHYGARSSFIDVTHSLEVALWFAHHKFVGRTLVADGKHVSAGKVEPGYDLEITAASYEKRQPGEKGYIFVFAARDSLRKGYLEHGDFIDLTRGRMSERMSVQQAGLLYASSSTNGGKVEPLASFEFFVPLKGLTKRVLNARTSDYFPSPATDLQYRLILESLPFLEDYTSRRVIRRPLPIPEYVDRVQDRPTGSQWKPFRNIDSALLPTHIFSVSGNLDRQSLMPFRGNIQGREYALGDATGILSRLPSNELVAQSADLAAPIDLPEYLLNVFLEYPPFQSFMPFLDKQYVLGFFDDSGGAGTLLARSFRELQGIRGVWLVKDDNDYRCQLFAFIDGDFAQYPGFYFRGGLPNELELVSPRLGNQEAEYLCKATLAALQHSLSILQQTVEGSLRLVESADPVFAYHLDHTNPRGWGL